MDSLEGKRLTKRGLTIAERFYLLAVIIESDNVREISRAYKMLTGGQGVRENSLYFSDIMKNVDKATKYQKKPSEERARKQAEYSRRYYEAHRDELNAKRKKWREEHREQYHERYKRYYRKNREFLIRHSNSVQ